MTVAEVRRKHGISNGLYYQWRPLEFIMAVPGRRYNEFEPILSELHEDEKLDLANAKDEVTGETVWQEHRLIWAHSPKMAEQKWFRLFGQHIGRFNKVTVLLGY